jgi:hypothetical protein
VGAIDRMALSTLYTGFTVTVLEAANAKWLFPLRKATLTEAKTGDINCETGLVAPKFVRLLKFVTQHRRAQVFA